MGHARQDTSPAGDNPILRKALGWLVVEATTIQCRHLKKQTQPPGGDLRAAEKSHLLFYSFRGPNCKEMKLLSCKPLCRENLN